MSNNQVTRVSFKLCEENNYSRRYSRHVLRITPIFKTISRIVRCKTVFFLSNRNITYSGKDALREFHLLQCNNSPGRYLTLFFLKQFSGHWKDSFSNPMSSIIFIQCIITGMSRRAKC